MKNLIKLFSVLMVMVGSFAFGQEVLNKNATQLQNEVNGAAGKSIKLACVTYSCCGYGPFGIEIWSEKTCVSLSSNKGTGSSIGVIDLKNSSKISYPSSEISIANDIVIPGDYKINSGEAEVYVMKAGKYQVLNGQIFFNPVTNKIRVTCISSQHSGHIFGHEYSFSYAICAFHLWINKGLNNNGFLTLDLSGNTELLDLARKNDNTLRFDEDLVSGNYIIKAGTYKVNDSKIYIQNYYTK